MYASTLVTKIKVGDIINVNTGNHPLDEEDCEVLKIEMGKTLFGDDMIKFYIKSYHGDHWYGVILEYRYGYKLYQTRLNKLIK